MQGRRVARIVVRRSVTKLQTPPCSPSPPSSRNGTLFSASETLSAASPYTYGIIPLAVENTRMFFSVWILFLSVRRPTKAKFAVASGRATRVPHKNDRRMTTRGGMQSVCLLHPKIAFRRARVSHRACLAQTKSGIWFTDGITSDKHLAACRRARI